MTPKQQVNAPGGEPVVLLRLRSDYARGERDRAVHVVPLSTATGGMAVAYCGIRLSVPAAEALPAFAGLPCTGCLHQASTRGGESRAASRPLPHRAPPIPANPGGPALGLRDEHMVHRIPERPITATLDGRTVVLSTCGVLAWTSDSQPPKKWPRCGECYERNARGILSDP
ncbi:hypothetical protein [Amycolatopsis cihanbeyliensis]|uniref:Uncharacterized protein n=1 Tax=Amycolatopsis cihanbeyliensis TaxID=1128664 RepID=A0A542DN45_AMYCI|nr:hypothetical protein [Amycolatopsis cihanbeyliensis]TQJ04487.1 hypothetical protein FB471_4284 [Amycolatopsis cihanbeyliensis]